MTEQDEFLRANREAIQQQIRRGLEELDRGEGIPEDELDSYLARMKAVQELLSKGHHYGAASGIPEDKVVDVIHASRKQRRGDT